MPIRIRNFSFVPNYFRYMQPHRNGNIPHLTNYAFYLRDPIATIGFITMILVPVFWGVDHLLKTNAGYKDIRNDPRLPYTGYNNIHAGRANWREERYGDSTDVGAVYEVHFNDGSVQQIQDYPASYAAYAKRLREEDEKYIQEAERMQLLQKKLREERQREWLRLNGKEQ